MHSYDRNSYDYPYLIYPKLKPLRSYRFTEESAWQRRLLRGYLMTLTVATSTGALNLMWLPFGAIFSVVVMGAGWYLLKELE